MGLAFAPSAGVVEFEGFSQGVAPWKRGCLNGVSVHEIDVTSPRYFKPREVCRLLGLTEEQLRYRRSRGQIRAQRYGSVWRYPAEDILRQQRETQARLAEEPGERDAIAVAMVNDGASDGEIIETLKLSLERVAALRATLRKDDAVTAPGAPPAARSSRSVVVDDDRDETRIRERYEARRELLAARRRAGYAPEPPPPLPKRKG